ncbi:hypothetical protein LSUE1_G007359 [Lachnellula suecica]|uniref:Uncharacterized protein n=1 Tax=Lachnellula suecica TaxID=602035 RepID=A0A8T9BYM7_9HELO|nr:hypothetical protein LSUE1_G007359 [Lachnellula suecica]
MANIYLIASVVVAIIAIALGAAYMTGALDPVIEKVGIMFFKAKAEAEAKKMQAQGMKEGEDFFKGELKGNKQAEDVKEGLGSVGGLKVGL